VVKHADPWGYGLGNKDYPLINTKYHKEVYLITKKAICQELADIIEGKLLSGQSDWFDREKTFKVIGLEWFDTPDDQNNVANAVLEH